MTNIHITLYNMYNVHLKRSKYTSVIYNMYYVWTNSTRFVSSPLTHTIVKHKNNLTPQT